MNQRAVALGIASFCVVLWGLASSAQAAGFCSTSAATEGIAPGDVTINGTSANDCYGVVAGNITGSGTFAGAPVIDGLAGWGTGWTYLDATDEASATFTGLSFTASAGSGSSGTWTLTGVDSNGASPLNFPTSLDMVVGLKAGSEYALWGFDNIVVDASDSGTFNIVFTNNGGQHPDLSHLILFARDASGGSVGSVPETQTWAMMLAGLGLVGLQLRRRKDGRHLLRA